MVPYFSKLDPLRHHNRSQFSYNQFQFSILRLLRLLDGDRFG
jgi:hypothetical protein